MSLKMSCFSQHGIFNVPVFGTFKKEYDSRGKQRYKFDII